MPGSAHHWDTIFAVKADHNLGWYEADVGQTTRFLDYIPDIASKTIFLPGAGTSLLVDELLVRGAHLILNDISGAALAKLRLRLGEAERRVRWSHHDISQPLPAGTPQVDVWLDRAVLHFLLTEPEIDQYFQNLQATLKPGGYALLAEFSSTGAAMCAGLEVHRYSVSEMTKRLGERFDLVHSEDYTFVNPASAPRPYVYALFHRH